MDWRGGRLQHYRKKGASRAAARQKAYFAKSRTILHTGQPDRFPICILNAQNESMQGSRTGNLVERHGNRQRRLEEYDAVAPVVRKLESLRPRSSGLSPPKDSPVMLRVPLRKLQPNDSSAAVPRSHPTHGLKSRYDTTGDTLCNDDDLEAQTVGSNIEVKKRELLSRPKWRSTVDNEKSSLAIRRTLDQKGRRLLSSGLRTLDPSQYEARIEKPIERIARRRRVHSSELSRLVHARRQLRSEHYEIDSRLETSLTTDQISIRIGTGLHGSETDEGHSHRKEQVQKLRRHASEESDCMALLTPSTGPEMMLLDDKPRHMVVPNAINSRRSHNPGTKTPQRSRGGSKQYDGSNDTVLDAPASHNVEHAFCDKFGQLKWLHVKPEGSRESLCSESAKSRADASSTSGVTDQCSSDGKAPPTRQAHGLGVPSRQNSTLNTASKLNVGHESETGSLCRIKYKAYAVSPNERDSNEWDGHEFLQDAFLENNPVSCLQHDSLSLKVNTTHCSNETQRKRETTPKTSTTTWGPTQEHSVGRWSTCPEHGSAPWSDEARAHFDLLLDGHKDGMLQDEWHLSRVSGHEGFDNSNASRASNLSVRSLEHMGSDSTQENSRVTDESEIEATSLIAQLSYAAAMDHDEDETVHSQPYLAIESNLSDIGDRLNSSIDPCNARLKPSGVSSQAGATSGTNRSSHKVVFHKPPRFVGSHCQPSTTGLGRNRQPGGGTQSPTAMTDMYLHDGNREAAKINWDDMASEIDSVHSH